MRTHDGEQTRLCPFSGRTDGAAPVNDASGVSRSRGGPIRAAAGRVVDSVSVSERRRAAVVVGVPFLFWLVVELAANLGFLPLVAAAVLSAFLYTRRSARETLAAGAYGTGMLAVGVALFQVYQTVAGGSTEALADTVVRLSGWPLTGVVLIILGAWLHRADF